ncbi:hypothetical protein BZA70DRAFT_290082 [Myxozyma melibiosi]|uniref:Methyltransferase domain-containing protein n=1 Tax=Myxozyma melibiosi TaxID=54550 RepID=A0ABR1F4J7_9ASCO
MGKLQRWAYVFAARIILTAVVFALLVAYIPVNDSRAAAIERIFLFFGVFTIVSFFVHISLALLQISIRKLHQSNDEHSEVYDLAHVMLNLDSTPPSTWNNMGYWPARDETTPACSFPDANLALAVKLARAANLGPDDCVLDIGIGCGDQSLVYAPMTRQYVGATSLADHAALATGKLRNAGLLGKASVYTLDCSVPDETHWPAEMLRSFVVQGDVNKILALDCLYHFTPSRARFLAFAHSSLEAACERLTKQVLSDSPREVCFAAEDLLLSSRSSLSLPKLLGLRAICLLTQTPFANFLDEHEYLSLLHAAGFTPAQSWTVELQDITEHVFPGLAGFLADRAAARDGVGRWLRFERFAVFGQVVRWWYTQRVVRAYIISARKSI